jgi:DNA polymerase-1
MNVQNIPRSQKDVKRAFLPKNAAYVFCDYKAVEVRLLAFYLAVGIGDASLVHEIKAGLDPHVETARGLFNTSSVTDEQRQIGKTLNFSIIYGGGNKTIMAQLGVSFVEARKLLKNYHDTRPGINRLRDVIDRTLATRGYIVSSHGRRLHVQDSHKALNALIQGSAADIMREAVVNVNTFLEPYGSHIVNIIHDEIMLDVTLEEMDLVCYNVPKLMISEKINKIVPLEVDVEYSTTNWAEKIPYE